MQIQMFERISGSDKFPVTATLDDKILTFTDTSTKAEVHISVEDLNKLKDFVENGLSNHQVRRILNREVYTGAQ
jgi:hypothetical protein